MSTYVKTSLSRKRGLSLFTLALALLFAVPGYSQSTNQILNRSESKIAFAISSPALSCDGRFTDFAGSLTLPQADLKSAKVNLSLNIDSISLPQDQIMQSLLINTLIQRLKSKRSTFESTAIEPLGSNNFLVTGFYTWEGKRKSGQIPIKLISSTPKRTEIRLNFNGKMKEKDVDSAALNALGDSVQGKAESKLVFQTK